jgi:hypothetical protein
MSSVRSEVRQACFPDRTTEAGGLPEVQQRPGEKASLADRVCFSAKPREYRFFGCLHNQHLRNELLAGRAPAGGAGGPQAMRPVEPV